MSEYDEVLRDATSAIRRANAFVESLGDPLSAKNLKRRMTEQAAATLQKEFRERKKQ